MFLYIKIQSKTYLNITDNIQYISIIILVSNLIKIMFFFTDSE